jgi:hypothetical protein
MKEGEVSMKRASMVSFKSETTALTKVTFLEMN